MPRRAFAISDLIFAIILILLIMMLLGPLLITMRRDARMRQNSNNLKGIYQSLYANADNGKFPTHKVPNAKLTDPLIGFRGKKVEGKIQKHEVLADIKHNQTAAIWRLVRLSQVYTEMFVNPLTEDEPQRTRDIDIDQTWDFYSRKNLSYSFLNMYDDEARNLWTSNVSPSAVVFADANPQFGDALKQQASAAQPSSANQTRKFSMSFGDGHVREVSQPYQAYNHNDNIYTAGEYDADGDYLIKAGRYGNRAERFVQTGVKTAEARSCDGSVTKDSERDIYLVPIDIVE